MIKIFGTKGRSKDRDTQELPEEEIRKKLRASGDKAKAEAAERQSPIDDIAATAEDAPAAKPEKSPSFDVRATAGDEPVSAADETRAFEARAVYDDPALAAAPAEETVRRETSGPEEDPVRMEIEELEQRLANYGFGFAEMKVDAPGEGAPRKLCRRVSCLILAEGEMPRIRREKHIPMREICEELDISPKKITPHERYILAVCEILDGDFPYLSEFFAVTREQLREAAEDVLE